MHMFSREKNFYGGHGIVGAQVPIGTGLAFAHKYHGNKNVSLTYFGDGSANQGQVYEAMNMAALWKLPVIYVIENNRYGMGTSVERSTAVTELYKHGEAFGIPGEAIDGMDVLAVRAAGERAVDHAKSGKGPYILEMQTYRYRGHSMSDPAKYRSKEEVDKYRNERDPIDHLRTRLIDQKLLDDGQIKAIDAEIRKVVNDAAEFRAAQPRAGPVGALDRRAGGSLIEMSTNVLMPALSPTMTEGKLAKWHVKVGDDVKSGQVICEIETDKATMEVEAVDEGKVAKILVAEGTEGVAVNTPICILAEEGETVSDAPPTAAPAPKVAEAPVAAKPSEEKKAAPPAPSSPASAPEPEYSGKTVKVTVREALRDAMAEEMRKDGNVFLMGEEVAQYQGAYKVSQGLLEEFGEKRVIDTPITEHGFAGLGVGAAFGGLRPIVEFMTFNFAMQAMDQIINSAAKTLYMSGGQMGCPIVFRGPNGAAARVGAQHSQCYASWYAHVPGLRVLAPWSAADHKGLLKAAIRDPNPVIFLENEILYGQQFDVPDDPDFVLPIGKAKIERAGKDVTITAFSIMVGKALAAAEELAKHGIEAEVINLRSLRPFDTETLVNSVKKTNRLVSVEEGWPFAGIGSELSALVMEHAFDYLDAPVKRVHGLDIPLPYAANLEKMALPQADNIVEAARAVCNR